ncbi:MAG: site-2 protease family protein [Gammaproteobacteria bacterium]
MTILLTGGTMLLSVFAYAMVFGVAYAAGFVALLFVHEMGHFIAARQRGLAVGAPTFIPFVGAWIEMKDLPHDAETEAYVGIAGPVAGTLGALAVYYAGVELRSPMLLALSYSGFFLNLFNLIPLSPFDGGRITAVISPRLWLVGVPILVGLFLYRPSPLLLLIAILAAPNVMRAWRGVSAEEARTYYVASASTRLGYGIVYLTLAAFLALMCDSLHRVLGRGF